MIFEFPIAVHPDVREYSRSCPHGFSSMIDHAPISESVCAAGRLLQQTENAIYTALSQHRFELGLSSPLVVRCPAPVIVLFYIVRGEAQVSQEQLGSLLMKEGTYCLYFVPKGEHQLQVEASHFTAVKVEVDLKMVEVLARHQPYFRKLLMHANRTPDSGWRLPAFETPPGARQLLTDIAQCIKEKDKRAMFMHECVARLLAASLYDIRRTQANKRQRYNYTEHEIAAVKMIESILADDKHRNIPLSKLIKKFGIGANKARELFFLQFGRDMRTHRTEKIAKEICERLLNTDHSVEQIAIDMEFKEPSIMRRLFKKKWGYTPSAYRRIFGRRNQ
ncbi:helix-turn-helix domain-containing protein [Chitinophaga horti]|uniref:Helix-turn-helix domain-containing protein n=1 Tax=Chitinophaga horti TaxID=2920382 RepID=A0ABY6J851_9BACT|nr:helix-turn-helix domain-containing protein [Chitinophaga horti]UYQ95506.1 helix-turn-helix domain-containing protein [Chitinophaga horti]